MLFSYNYVDHPLAEIQSWIDYLFVEVWCKPQGDFSIEKLDNCPELRRMVLAIYHDERITTDYLYGPIERIYNCFSALSQDERDELEVRYRDNNCIGDLCSNAAHCNPTHYKDLAHFDGAFIDDLKNLFISFFENIIGLSVVKSSLGTLVNHYNHFHRHNAEHGVCPYCALIEIQDDHDDTREAYDHYLPKSKYPFNAINFHNLSPMCHRCNSTCKSNKDPLHKNGVRRKAFYPYAGIDTDISVSVSLEGFDMDHLSPTDIVIEIASDAFPEELDTWEDLFSIKARYNEKLRNRNSAKVWYTEIMDFHKKAKMSAHEYYELQAETAAATPFQNANFLKIPFLDACAEKGLFD